MNPLMTLDEAFHREFNIAESALRSNDLDSAFHHFERAHILGQRQIWRHFRTHIGLLRVGWARRDLREILGQLPRLVAALLFSRIWVPAGNPGGARVSALRAFPVPADLQPYLDTPPNEAFIWSSEITGTKLAIDENGG